MSCRRGIFRVNRKELDAIDQGTIKAAHSIVFGKVDGLASVQCNGVSKPAGWKSRDGRIWFPTIRGVVAMESNIDINDRPPPVVIEGRTRAVGAGGPDQWWFLGSQSVAGPRRS